MAEIDSKFGEKFKSKLEDDDNSAAPIAPSTPITNGHIETTNGIHRENNIAMDNKDEREEINEEIPVDQIVEVIEEAIPAIVIPVAPLIDLENDQVQE